MNKMHNPKEIVEQARKMEGYEEASRFRQACDLDQLLDLAPSGAHSLLDLGCGIGTLLERAAKRLPALRLMVGLDRIPERLKEAQSRLRTAGPEVTLIEADLHNPPPMKYKFDLISMTSVLHWLHPREDRLFAWADAMLNSGGVFLLSTYHPEYGADETGGTDLLVYDALALLGIDSATARSLFRSRNILHISQRTLGIPELKAKLSKYFFIDHCDKKLAEMRINNSAEYQRYHAATFGTYYSALLEPERESSFFEALGFAAEQRMQECGVVTSMPVILWRCMARR